jgi:hypothetical protein
VDEDRGLEDGRGEERGSGEGSVICRSGRRCDVFTDI